MSYFSSFNLAVHSTVDQTIFTDSVSKPLSQDVGLEQWKSVAETIRNENRMLFFIGNGASSAMASHMAADFTKNGGFRSMTFTDPPLITAISNDESYADSFSLCIDRFASEKDLLVTISSSGNSPNIIRALELANSKGLSTVTLSGMSPENKSRALGDLNIYVPGESYGIVECSHQILLHCWLDNFLGLDPK